jgi:transposase
VANQLAMDKALAIKALAAAGRSERQIAAALSVSRKAVRRQLGRSNSKETKAPTGSSETVDAPLATVSEASTDHSAKAKSRSLCVAFQDSILKKLDQGLTAQRVFQDLRDEHGFTGKYSSVRRFVRALGERRELAFRRMEGEPSYELQVD